MKTVDAGKGSMLIINGKSDPGRKLQSLGGVAAILRYKAHF